MTVPSSPAPWCRSTAASWPAACCRVPATIREESMKRLIVGFIAGFVATLVFHQIALLIIAKAAGLPIPIWDLSPAPPFGVPKVISLAFWGGIWGIALAWVEPRFPKAAAAYWLTVAI